MVGMSTTSTYYKNCSASFRCTEPILEQMDAEAARLGISRSEWIRLAHVLASHILLLR